MVVGFDRHINYYKIQTAQLCISENPGCLFIATNLDAKTHLTDAQEWAGNGAMVGAIKGAETLGPAPPLLAFVLQLVTAREHAAGVQALWWLDSCCSCQCSRPKKSLCASLTRRRAQAR